ASPSQFLPDRLCAGKPNRILSNPPPFILPPPAAPLCPPHFPAAPGHNGAPPFAGWLGATIRVETPPPHSTSHAGSSCIHQPLPPFDWLPSAAQIPSGPARCPPQWPFLPATGPPAARAPACRAVANTVHNCSSKTPPAPGPAAEAWLSPGSNEHSHKRFSNSRCRCCPPG